MREGESVSLSGSRSGPNGILIAQITDCHLPADPQQTYRGINPHKNLRTLLMKVRAMKPDLLLATGDLSEDGSRASYRALQEYFRPLGVPVLALPGNHDNDTCSRKCFQAARLIPSVFQSMAPGSLFV
jgi:Icc protein